MRIRRALFVYKKMAKKSKILYLITQSEWGGAGRYVFDLATNFKDKNYDVEVAAGGNEELFDKLKNYGVKTYKIKNLVRPISSTKDLAAYWEIKKLLNQTKPDILHLNSSKAGVIGAIAGRHAGVKKIIYTVHGFVFNEPMSKLKKFIYLNAEKLSARYKDKLICVSDFDKQAGLENKIAAVQKFITIHNGLPNLSFLPKDQARIELGLPTDQLVIGTIANLYPTKGLIYFIRAAEIIAKKVPDAFFKIVGFGQQQDELRAEINKAGLDNCFLIGPKSDAYRYLKAFDIFVLPSVKEGLPFAIMEAMQAGLPIIATNVGGITEMITDNYSGLLVPPAQPQALADAIFELIGDKSLAKDLGTKAKIDVEKKFNLQNMLSETEKVYQS